MKKYKSRTKIFLLIVLLLVSFTLVSYIPEVGPGRNMLRSPVVPTETATPTFVPTSTTAPQTPTEDTRGYENGHGPVWVGPTPTSPSIPTPEPTVVEAYP